MPNKAAKIAQDISAKYPGASIKARGKRWVDFDVGGGQSARVFTIAPIHRGEGPSFSQADEINDDWQASGNAPYLWEVAFDRLTAYAIPGNDIFSAGALVKIADRATGESIEFTAQQLQWIDYNPGANSDAGISQISDQQSVNLTQRSGTRLHWAGAYGPGRNYTYIGHRSKLSKELEIETSGDLPAPPGSFANEPWLRLLVSTRISSNIEIRVNGQPYSGPQKQILAPGSNITYHNKSNGDLLWQIRAPQAWDSEFEAVGGALDIDRSGQAYIIGIRIPGSWLVAPERVYPVYIDPTTFYTGAGDGDVARTDVSTWADAQGTADGEEVDYTGSQCRILTRVLGGGSRWWVHRTFWPFDTSSLPDAATITAVDFKVYVVFVVDGENDAQSYITVVQTNQASTSSLAVGDFDVCGDAVDNPTEGVDTGGRLDITSLTTSAFNTFTLNATGRGWVSTTGYTKLGIREGHDTTDTAPGDRNNIDIATSESSNDPELVVTYTSGTDLTVAEMAFGLTFDAPTLTQTHILTVAEMAFALSNEGPVALTQTHILAVDPHDYALAIDGPLSLAQTHILTVDPHDYALAFDGPLGLSQVHNLAVDPADFALAFDNVDLTQAHNITVAEMAFALGFEGPVTLSTAIDLIVAAVDFALAFDAPTLTQTHILTVAAHDYGLTFDGPITITVGGIDLVVAEMAFALAFDGPLSLTQTHILVVAPHDYALAFDNVDLTQTHILIVAPHDYGLAIDGPLALAQTHILTVAELAFALSADAPTLTQAHILVVEALDFAVTIDGNLVIVAQVIDEVYGAGEILQSLSGAGEIAQALTGSGEILKSKSEEAEL